VTYLFPLVAESAPGHRHEMNNDAKGTSLTHHPDRSRRSLFLCTTGTERPYMETLADEKDSLFNQLMHTGRT
jgi:hypothetical protein